MRIKRLFYKALLETYLSWARAPDMVCRTAPRVIHHKEGRVVPRTFGRFARAHDERRVHVVYSAADKCVESAGSYGSL